MSPAIALHDTRNDAWIAHRCSRTEARKVLVGSPTGRQNAQQQL